MAEHDEYGAKLDAGFSALEQASGPTELPKSSVIELSTGVIIEPRPVSPYIMQAILKQFPMPEVPKFYNEQKGREEENPMHPDYLERVQDVQIQRSTAMLDAMLGLGATILEVPKGLSEFESSDWKNDAASFGLHVPQTTAGQKVLWLKMIAAPLGSDIEKIVGGIAALSGVTEKAVADALPNFRR